MKYIILGILILWIIRRFARIASAVSNDGSNSPKFDNSKKKQDDKKGEYVDFEEIED